MRSPTSSGPIADAVTHQGALNSQSRKMPPERRSVRKISNSAFICGPFGESDKKSGVAVIHRASGLT